MQKKKVKNFNTYLYIFNLFKNSQTKEKELFLIASQLFEE